MIREHAGLWTQGLEMLGWLTTSNDSSAEPFVQASNKGRNGGWGFCVILDF